MGDAEAQFRDRLEAVGLAHHADALVELASPSIRLRSEAEPSEPLLTRLPAAVWELQGAVTAIAGSYHKVALREDGTVAAWGENGAGQVGDGTKNHRRSPVEVQDLTDVCAIAAGTEHSLALTASGEVLAWGSNQWGELGDDTKTNRHRPVPVQGLGRGVVAIAAGHMVSLALMSDGSVFGWGLNPLFEPGDQHTIPVRCATLDGVVAVATGGSERLALAADGSVLAWGSSPSDLSGTDAVLGPASWGSGPRAVEGLPGPIRAIACGNNHSLVLTGEGAVFAWGSNRRGELGDDTREDRYPPVAVSGLGAGVRAIAAGTGCSYALTDDGGVYSWGWNFDGRLGDGSAPREPNGASRLRLAPGPVPSLGEGVAAISELMALMGDGSVRVWGGEYPADERGADARLDLAATKLGGRPDLRARSRWPTRDGQTLSFVAQLDLAEVAPLDPTGLLPPAGLLSFFYGDPPGPLEPALCALVFSERGTQLTRREFPKDLSDRERYAAVALQPEVELTLPPEPPLFLSESERDAYQWDLDEEPDPVPRHRLLGHPDLVQDDPREGGAGMLLLQIDSDEGARMTWGDVGRVYYLIQPDDLGTKRFEASRCEFQSH